MTKNSFFEKIVHFTAENIPFIFLIDFEKNKPQLFSFQEALENGIYVNIKGKGNFPKQQATGAKARITKQAFSKEAYAKACLLYTSPSPRDLSTSRMPSSA